MASGWTIYTIGMGEYLSNIFNYTAMMCSSEYLTTFMSLFATLGMGIEAWRGALNQQNGVKMIGYWMAKYAIIISLFFIPVRVEVYDMISKENRPIDNVPSGIAVPYSFISTFGSGVTTIFEKFFSTIGGVEQYTPYHSHGFIFGSRMLSDLQASRVHDARFHQNFRNFLRVCVIPDSMYGAKYTISDIMKSENIWETIKKGSSHMRHINYQKGDGTEEELSCHEAAKEMDRDWTSSYQKSIKKGMHSLVSFDAKMKGLSDGGALGVDFTSIGPLPGSTVDLHKQQAMINAIQDHARSFAGARTQLNQTSSFYTTGESAGTILPILKGVMQILLCSLFLFVVGFSVIPGWDKAIFTYIEFMVWLELWAPLYAVLNSVMHSVSITWLKDVGPLTIENAPRIYNINTQIAGYAGYLSMSIPFISYAILKGGVGQLMHVAGGITGATTAAASHSAQEMVTGNYTLNNRSFDNLQYSNMNAYKHNTNADYSAGNSRYSTNEGASITQLGGGVGDMIDNIGTMDNIKGIQIGHGVQHSASIQKSISDTFSVRESAGEIQSLAASTNKAAVDRFSISNALSLGDKYGIENVIATMDDKQVRDIQTAFAKGELQFSADKTIAGKVGQWITGMNVRGSIGKGYNHDISTSHGDSTSHRDTIMQDKSFQDMVSQAAEITKSDSILESATKQYNQADEKVKALQKMLSNAESYNWNISVDGTQEYSEWLKGEIGAERSAHETRNQEHIDRYMKYLEDNGSIDKYLSKVAGYEELVAFPDPTSMVIDKPTGVKGYNELEEQYYAHEQEIENNRSKKADEIKGGFSNNIEQIAELSYLRDWANDNGDKGMMNRLNNEINNLYPSHNAAMDNQVSEMVQKMSEQKDFNIDQLKKKHAGLLEVTPTPQYVPTPTPSIKKNDGDEEAEWQYLISRKF